MKVYSQRNWIKKQLKQYLIDHITAENYQPEPLNGTQDRLHFFAQTIEDEYAENRECLGPRWVEQYLLGLPSCIDMPFSYHDIEELGRHFISQLIEEEARDDHGFLKFEVDQHDLINWWNDNYWGHCGHILSSAIRPYLKETA